MALSLVWLRQPRFQIRYLNLLCSMAVVAGLTFGAVAPAAAQSIQLEPIASGLARPIDIAHAGDGSGRLFFVLQGGRIVIHDGGQVLPTPFLDIGSLVTCCGEQGLLGVAFHPDYAVNGLFYVNYVDRSGDTVIVRYRVSADPNVADPTTASILLTISQPFGNHNGGQMQFGPDGYLYIASGDGGSGGDPGNRAQDLGTLLGKILRIDVDGGSPYAVPTDNPFTKTSGALPEIWAYGLRNPFRFSFDRETGDLFIGDVGQDRREEIDFQPADSPGGENYGWRLMEGSLCFNPSSNCNDGSLVLPILEYDHVGASCSGSVTGGYRYRGPASSRLGGLYFYADFCKGRIWAATRQSDGGWTTEEALDTAYRFSTFGEDEEGALYIAHLNNTNGIVFRIEPVVSPENDVATDFGAADGLWARFDDSFWAKLNSQSPRVLAAGDIDNSGQDELIADFGPGAGLWVWRDNTAWEPLHGASADDLETGDLDSSAGDEVIVDFGPPDGLWARFNDSAWVKLNSQSPNAIATGDLDDNGRDEVIASFGPGIGLWAWRNNSTWEKLDDRSAEDLETGDLDADGRDEVIADFGPGVGLWALYNDGTWAKLNDQSPQVITVADLDGNGVDEVVAGFGAGVGLWVWRNNSAWEKLNSQSPEDLETADLDGSGQEDLIVDFGPGGLWAYLNDGSFRPLNSQSPEFLQSGNFDGL